MWSELHWPTLLVPRDTCNSQLTGLWVMNSYQSWNPNITHISHVVNQLCHVWNDIQCPVDIGLPSTNNNHHCFWTSQMTFCGHWFLKYKEKEEATKTMYHSRKTPTWSQASQFHSTPATETAVSNIWQWTNFILMSLNSVSLETNKYASSGKLIRLVKETLLLFMGSPEFSTG